MHLKGTLSLFMLCLFLSCSILNKNKDQVAESQPEPAVDSQQVTEYAYTDPTPLTGQDSLPEITPPKEPLEYMSLNEKAMIDEINLLRADPISYIQYVDEYLQQVMDSDQFDYAEKQQILMAADELVRQLQTLQPLPLLQYSEELHLVAQKHGLDMKSNGFVNHRGSDGSMPVERIQDSTALTGVENLVFGGQSIRESLIMLLVLVDANDKAARMQRKAILNPAWEYAACYYVGRVNEMPNTWVQLFALSDPNEISEDSSEITMNDLADSVNELPDESNDEGVADFSFMGFEEKKMIYEINLLRSNPSGYIPMVEKYAAEMKQVLKGANPDFDKAVNELITQLKNTPNLSILKPHQPLYLVAKKHGLENKNNHQLEHQGLDGRWSFDRIEDAGLENSINEQGEYAPNENLVGGEASVRNSVLALLIDAGIPNRGHRRALLEPSWEYLACYKIGTIEDLKDLQGMADADMKNCWVQLFAKGKGDSSADKSEPSNIEEVSSVDVAVEPDPEPLVEETDSNQESLTNLMATGEFSFMTAEEKAMIDEINLLRSNPPGYIQYVDQYANEMKKIMMNVDPDFEVAVQDLKDQLKSMSPLTILKPHQQLYEVTRAHGEDNKKHHQLEHRGTDGRQSFDRVKSAGLKNSINQQGIYAPNENLVGGEANVRNSVLALLIDSGIPSRGHRKALIEPTWEYIACYKIGMIEDLKDLRGMEDDDMDNCWVQFFARD